MILDKIVATKKEEVAQAKRNLPLAVLQEAIKKMALCRDFRKALNADPCAIIAEVKRASPSRGLLADEFDPVRMAKVYEENGAAAVSVLTDEKYFMGHKNHLAQIRERITLPVLRKDFIIDPYQIYESRAIGADAVLLIVRILGSGLRKYLEIARDVGLEPLVEVHNGKELEAALASDARVIGINNRNLDTFVTDTGICRELARFIPRGRTAVAESAIKSRKDIEEITDAGINAFLVGEVLVTAEDAGRKLKELRGKR